jgi:hypothetical protein
MLGYGLFKYTYRDAVFLAVANILFGVYVIYPLFRFLFFFLSFFFLFLTSSLVCFMPGRGFYLVSYLCFCCQIFVEQDMMRYAMDIT